MQIINSPDKENDIKEKASMALFVFMRGNKDAEELGVNWLQKGFIHPKADSTKSLF